MKAIRSYLIFAVAVTLAPWAATAQQAGTLYLTGGIGAISYTNDYSTHSWESPESPGFLGRLGVQFAVAHPRFALSAEYEFSSVPQEYDARLVGICRNFSPPDVCDGRPSKLSAFTFSLRFPLLGPAARVEPYALAGAGWIQELDADRPETIGPKTDLGFGISIDPFRNGLLNVAIEPRYSFFYFREEPDEDNPSHVSVAVVTRVRLVRW